MVMLQNLSHLEPYISDKLHEKLYKSTVMRMENEIKMQFFQSRYAGLNLTTLSRLCTSERGYTDAEKV